MSCTANHFNLPQNKSLGLSISFIFSLLNFDLHCIFEDTLWQSFSHTWVSTRDMPCLGFRLEKGETDLHFYLMNFTPKHYLTRCFPYSQHSEMAEEIIQLKTLQTILIIFQSRLHPETEVNTTSFWCRMNVMQKCW